MVLKGRSWGLLMETLYFPALRWEQRRGDQLASAVISDVPVVISSDFAVISSVSMATSSVPAVISSDSAAISSVPAVIPSDSAAISSDPAAEHLFLSLVQVLPR